MWIVPVKGSAKALYGIVEVGANGAVTGTLVIDAASFDTKNKTRDDHPRSEDFFEIVKFPTMVFTTSEGRATGSGRVAITGVLTIHGHSRPLTLRAEVMGSRNSATVTTEVELDRSLWGLTWAKMGTGLKSHIAIRAHFDRV
jgi:polyisoprenoid-binding protein YceI